MKNLIQLLAIVTLTCQFTALSEAENNSDINQGIFIAPNFGTSFSPGGVGAGVGFSFPTLTSEIGMGAVSKNGAAGYPVYANMRIRLPENLFLSPALSMYSGSGKAQVKYSSYASTQEEKATWRIVYGHVSAGGFIEAGPTSKFIFAIGLAKNLYTNVSVKDKADIADLGEPIGIVVDNTFGEAYMGPGDLGSFLQVGFQIAI